MLISRFSSNVILAKARAMYGNSLKAKDYTNLLNCHSVSEIASYLKNNTSIPRCWPISTRLPSTAVIWRCF